MNDLLFMIVEENLRPDVPDRKPLWFVIVPNAWRTAIYNHAHAAFSFGGQGESLLANQVPFALTRLATTLVFGILALVLAWKFSSRFQETADASLFLQAAFLTLAWFWLLSPTQNPWYWSWALPFVAFGRSRLWLGLAGLSLIYYLRFWFLYELPQRDILSTGHVGVAFFDFVLVWIEFGPWLLMLGAVSACRLFLKRSNQVQP